MNGCDEAVKNAWRALLLFGQFAKKYIANICLALLDTLSGNWLPQYLFCPKTITQSKVQLSPETGIPTEFPPDGSMAGGPPDMTKSVVTEGFVKHGFHYGKEIKNRYPKIIYYLSAA